MSYMLTGEVTGVSKIATGTPAALAASAKGRFSIDPNNAEFDGMGGQIQGKGGSLGIRIDVDCVGVDAADIALWWPETPCVQVAAFPDIVATLDDGTNGAQYVLSAGQPAGFKASLGPGPDAQLIYTLGIGFALATPQAAAVDAAVYTTYLGHSRGDVVVAMPGDEGALSFDLEAAIELEMHDPLNARGAAAKRFPEGLYIKSFKPQLSVVTSQLFTIAELMADVYTGNAITITCTNGTAAENVTFTIADAAPSGALDSAMESGTAMGFGQMWKPKTGNRFGWCAVT